MRGGCVASSTIVPARFDRRATSPHVALPLGQRVTGTDPHGAMAPRQHGQLAQLRPVYLLALPTKRRVGATFQRLVSRLFFAQTDCFLLRYVSPWGTSTSQKLSDAPLH